ncbi:MAG: hypothetical protein EA394_00680 [Bacteroidia bacterium]|nr:MAG: hypothetical protein EA394_00680 [Bacteroidia bacterium]
MNTQNMESKQNHSQKRKWTLPKTVNARKYLWAVGAFTLLGVMGGYAYYFFIGCQTGGCTITSNPYMSMAWGGAVGYLLPDFFVKKDKNDNQEQSDSP